MVRENRIWPFPSKVCKRLDLECLRFGKRGGPCGLGALSDGKALHQTKGEGLPPERVSGCVSVRLTVWGREEKGK